MKKKIIALFAVLLGVISVGKAQEIIIYNQYHFHYYLMNPALAGAAECTHFMLNHKQQWIGIKDAPYTSILSFQTRTRANLGLGAYLYNDKNGYSYQQGAQFTVAYHIPMSRGRRFSRATSLDRQLSFGLSGKFYRYELDQEVVDAANAAGENIERKHGIYPNANFGVFYQSYHFFTGLSVTNMLPVKIDMFGDTEPVRPITGMFQIGYDFESGENWLLEPSFVFKMDQDTRKQLDIGFRVLQDVDDRDMSWWAGVIVKQNFDKEYKSLVMVPNFTVRMGKFRFGYALNLDLNKLVGHSYSTHELMLGYSLCSTKKFCR